MNESSLLGPIRPVIAQIEYVADFNSMFVTQFTRTGTGMYNPKGSILGLISSDRWRTINPIGFSWGGQTSYDIAVTNDEE
jgi:hypothetical protein